MSIWHALPGVVLTDALVIIDTIYDHQSKAKPEERLWFFKKFHEWFNSSPKGKANFEFRFSGKGKEEQKPQEPQETDDERKAREAQEKVARDKAATAVDAPFIDVAYDEVDEKYLCDYNDNNTLLDPKGNALRKPNGDCVVLRNGYPICINASGVPVVSIFNIVKIRVFKAAFNCGDNTYCFYNNDGKTLVDLAGKPVLGPDSKPLILNFDPKGKPIVKDADGRPVDGVVKPINVPVVYVAVDPVSKEYLLDTSKRYLLGPDGQILMDLGNPIFLDKLSYTDLDGSTCHIIFRSVNVLYTCRIYGDADGRPFLGGPNGKTVMNDRDEIICDLNNEPLVVNDDGCILTSIRPGGELMFIQVVKSSSYLF